MSLESAVKAAVNDNPEIGQAIANREAIEFELMQGRGLFLPTLDLETRIGGQIRDNKTTHGTSDNHHLFYRREGSLVLRQLLFDGFKTYSEVERQAARVDGASLRVLERGEFIALSVIREYLDIYRLRKIVAIVKRNISYHNQLLKKLQRGTSEGSVSIADEQQARERLHAARARLSETTERLIASEASFIRLVGRPVGKVRMPKSVVRYLPKNLAMAIDIARKQNPTVKIVNADIDAAAALVRKAESNFYPKLYLEGSGTIGHNLDGVRGHYNDVQGNVVVSWNLFNGGIDRANKQEQIRRVDELHERLLEVLRSVEEGVRISWNRRISQMRRLREVKLQAATISRLVGTYSDQFDIGQRSLLDLLDTHNTKYTVESAVVTAQSAVNFANYRVLAATGSLLSVLGVKATPAANAYAREQARAEPPLPAVTEERYLPDRTGSGLGPLY